MNAEDLLSRLERVRQTGPGRWLACCPAHEDKHPSLSVRELDDGRILLHDFGCCGLDAVLAAMGLSIGDLFPERLPDHPRRGVAAKIPALDILHAVALEIEVVAVAACDLLAAGHKLSSEDHGRLRLAASRLRSAAGAARGYR